MPRTEPVATHELEARALEEVEQLAPWHDLARQARGRTTVGLCGLSPDGMVRFLARFLDAEAPGETLHELPLGEAFKLVSEDLKAYCLEAATAQPSERSSREVAAWFWRDTATGRLFRAVHEVCVAHSDPGVRAIATGAFIPRSQQL